MDALFSDEEQLLQETIDGQLDKAVPKTVPELVEYDDRALWSSLADGHLLSLGLPEQIGGAGTMVDSSIVTRSLGAAVAPAPYVGCTVLAGQLLARANAAADVFERLVAGRLRLAVGCDAELRGLAVLGRDDEIVAFDAAKADAALVLDETSSVAAIPLGDRRPNLDLTRELVGCSGTDRVDVGDLGGPLTADDLAAWRAAALVGVASDLAGNMAGALRLAVEHASTRYQFGVPIGSFQAVQHLIADAFVQTDGSRGIVSFAAWLLDHGSPDDAMRAATTAKAYCSEAGKQVIEAVLQVHGGMGMTWDCLAHVYQRRILTNRAMLGDEHVHYAALAGG